MQDPQALVNKALAENAKKMQEKMAADFKKANELADRIDKLFDGFDLPVIAFALAQLEDALEAKKPGILFSAKSIHYQTIGAQSMQKQSPISLIRR